MFVNNGHHDWLKLIFRYYGIEADIVGKKLNYNIDTDQAKISYRIIENGPGFTDYELVFGGLTSTRLSKISFTKNDLTGKLTITSSQWGY